MSGVEELERLQAASGNVTARSFFVAPQPERTGDDDTVATVSARLFDATAQQLQPVAADALDSARAATAVCVRDGAPSAGHGLTALTSHAAGDDDREDDEAAEYPTLRAWQQREGATVGRRADDGCHSQFDESTLGAGMQLPSTEANSFAIRKYRVRRKTLEQALDQCMCECAAKERCLAMAVKTMSNIYKCYLMDRGIDGKPRSHPDFHSALKRGAPTQPPTTTTTTPDPNLRAVDANDLTVVDEGSCHPSFVPLHQTSPLAPGPVFADTNYNDAIIK